MKNKNKFDVFFNNITKISTSFVRGFLYFIWSIILTIVRSPLFWVFLIVLFYWYICTYPTETQFYCPSCHQVIK